jgi:hypothetical protein
LGQDPAAASRGGVEHQGHLALHCDEPPRYERERSDSAVDVVEPRIRELPATVIAERIGSERGIAILRDRVAELRPCSCHRIRGGGDATRA